MHLTVEFLGEIENSRLNLIKDSIDKLDFPAFLLELTKAGYFSRPDGNIYWLGIKENITLINLQKNLRKSLLSSGFELEDREYKPHITLGRKVILKDSFNLSELEESVGKIQIAINKVDLMKSEFKNGKLIYTLLYSKKLY